MRRKMRRYFSPEVEKIIPWQEYVQAKWTSALYERFKDVRSLWRRASVGTDEERSQVNEQLSNLFYEEVLPALLRLFGEEIKESYSYQQFYNDIGSLIGIDVDKDYLSKLPGYESWVA